MPVSNPTETIDPRILRLIGLDDVFDLDYDTYLTLLKEAMVKSRMPNTSIPTEEVELLTNEYKRVKTKKDQGRFKVEKKKISTGSFSVGKVKGLIAPAAPKGLLPASALSKSPTINKVEEDISAIAKSMNSIVEILSGQKKLNEDAAAYEKRKAEQDKRALAESKLEKRFEGLKKAAEKVLAPVKSILSKIIKFLTTVFLGNVVLRLLEWFADPKNAEKVQSIIRFFGDHWPKLLSLYILFGTSFGRFARGLIRVAVKGTIRLGLAIAKLLAAKKVKGAMGVARFLGRGPGKLLGAGLTALGTAGLAYAGTKALEGGEDKVQGFRGGGFVIPRFSGGGFNFGSLFNGLVNGQKGVDKVPAMLSDGEFVMSRGAVQKYGVDTLEAMNAAGGGTNKPKLMSDTVYAAGGGYIGNDISSSLRSKYDTKHGKGAYDKRLSEKKARLSQEDAAEEARKKRIADNAAARKNSRPGEIRKKRIDYTSVNGIRIPGLKVDPTTLQLSADQIAKKASSSAQGLVSSVSASTKVGKEQLTPELQKKIAQDNAERNRIIQDAQRKRDAAKKARAEYVKIINNPDDPRYQDAWDGKITIDSLKVDNKSTSDYKPYVSRFAGARDAAFSKAKMIGGFSGIKSQNYYKANTAAREKQLSGLTSQQRLNKLSYEGSYGRSGAGGRRFVAESKARKIEFDKRGGLMGQLGRLGTRMFGGEAGRRKLTAQDTASTARVKQAGAASIGRYYSSSDGKYYKDYNAAVQAKKVRLAQQQKKSAPAIKPPIKPKPKYNPAGGGMGGGRGSGSSPGSTVRTPQFSARNPGASNAKQKVLGMTS